MPQSEKRAKPARGEKKVPHLFAKLMVTWCVFCGTAFSGYAIWAQSRTGIDLSATLGIVVGFLGGELVIMGARTIFSEKNESKKERKVDCD